MCIRDSTTPWTTSCSATRMPQDLLGQRGVLDSVDNFGLRSGHKSQDSRVQRCAYGAANRFVQRFDH
eukprot:2847213-Alexandrium_andersonii.AAC.1